MTMSDLWVDHVSFSQLTTVAECSYAFYLQKAVGIEPLENAFAQAGSLAHQLLAEWARGELQVKDLPVQWNQRFAKVVTAEFPHFLTSKGYAEKLFGSVLSYFDSFGGFPGFEIVGVEREFQSSIAGEKFVGIIDLILRNKETGGLMIVDHKSASLSSFRKNKENMYRQLLLYSKYCADEYGEFPEKLCFNLFKENLLDERSFDREAYIAARLWAESVIKEMKTKEITDWFQTNHEYFKCVNICNCRNECFFGKAENHKRKENIDGKKRVSAVA